MDRANRQVAEELVSAVIPAAGEVITTQSPLRSPEPGEVRVRLEGCGVCASISGPGPDRTG